MQARTAMLWLATFELADKLVEKMKDKMMRHGKNKGWDKMSMMKQMMQLLY